MMARTTAVALLIVAIPLIAVVGGGGLMETISQREKPDCEKPPMGRWKGYTTEELSTYWSNLRPEGLAAERKFIELDLIFPFVYGGALLASILLARASLGRPFSPAILIGIVAVAMLADWIENLVHLRELSTFVPNDVTSLNGAWVAVASAATTTKWTAVYASVIAVIGLAGAVMIHPPRTG